MIDPAAKAQFERQVRLVAPYASFEWQDRLCTIRNPIQDEGGWERFVVVQRYVWDNGLFSHPDEVSA